MKSLTFHNVNTLSVQMPRGGISGGDVLWRVVTDFATAHKELAATLASIEAVLDLDTLRSEAARLEEAAGKPDLWDDPDNAQQLTSRLSVVQGDVRRIVDLRHRVDDLAVLHELAEAEDDASAKAEVEGELRSLQRSVEELEVRTLLSGPYDEREALITVKSEAGGVDAADWAQMLLRMYLRWAERHGYPTEVYDTSYAEEAGIKSATFAVQAPYAYGTLSSEHGTHRLVRISPFDNQNRRQTSFAGVDVVPVVAQTDHIDIDENEIRIDVFRSAGRAGRASTPPTRRSGSPTSPPASWSAARTRRARSRTGRRRCGCCRPSCWSASGRKTPTR